MTEEDYNEQPKCDDNPAGAFVHSLGHTVIQAPIDLTSEVVNTFAGKQVIPKLEIVKKPEKAEFSSKAWHAQNIGTGVGIVAGLLFLGRILRGR